MTPTHESDSCPSSNGPGPHSKGFICVHLRSSVVPMKSCPANEDAEARHEDAAPQLERGRAARAAGGDPDCGGERHHGRVLRRSRAVGPRPPGERVVGRLPLGDRRQAHPDGIRADGGRGQARHGAHPHVSQHGFGAGRREPRGSESGERGLSAARADQDHERRRRARARGGWRTEAGRRLDRYRARRAHRREGGRSAAGRPGQASHRRAHHARARQRPRLLRHRAARAHERSRPRGHGPGPGGKPRDRAPAGGRRARCGEAVPRAGDAQARAGPARGGRARFAKRGAHGARALAALPRARLAALRGAGIGRGRARRAPLLAAPGGRRGDDALPGRHASRDLLRCTRGSSPCSR